MEMAYMDKLIKWLYHRKAGKAIRLPFYLTFGDYRLCMYAMNLDWESLRIKIEKDYKIKMVIKRGLY